MHNHAIQLGMEKDGIMKIFQGAEEKNKMIKQMKGTSVNISEVESMWKFFESRLAQFNDKIES
jgi:hypothetical protein